MEKQQKKDEEDMDVDSPETGCSRHQHGEHEVTQQKAAGKPEVGQPEETGKPNKKKESRNDPSSYNQQQLLNEETQGYSQTYGQGNGQGYSQSGAARYQEDTQRGFPNRHDQMQEHILREAQASKQMVYEVFGNCITMLEEMESRELKEKGHIALPRSEIFLPDQEQFDDKTIQRKLDTQLLILQCQLVSCHEQIRDGVKEELKVQTIHWGSQREEEKIPNGLTDNYAQKLFGLLETGKTDHPKEFNEPPIIGEEDMHKALGAIVQGQHKQSNLDRDFRDDPKKKATAPKLRKTAGLDKGADRMVKGKPEYEQAVNNHRSSWR